VTASRTRQAALDAATLIGAAHTAGLRATATLGLVHQAGPFIPIGSG